MTWGSLPDSPTHSKRMACERSRNPACKAPTRDPDLRSSNLRLSPNLLHGWQLNPAVRMEDSGWHEWISFSVAESLISPQTVCWNPSRFKKLMKLSRKSFLTLIEPPAVSMPIDIAPSPAQSSVTPVREPTWTVWWGRTWELSSNLIDCDPASQITSKNVKATELGMFPTTLMKHLSKADLTKWCELSPPQTTISQRKEIFEPDGVSFQMGSNCNWPVSMAPQNPSRMFS